MFNAMARIDLGKWLARNENKAFWQWFWARSQKCFKTALWRLQGPEIRFRAKNRSRAMKMDRQIDWRDRPIDISICRQIDRHTYTKINTWTHKTFQFFDLHLSLFPFHAKTRSHTPQMVISLQTSFKNESWQRSEQSLAFKAVSRCFWDASRRFQSGSKSLQNAPRRLWDAFRVAGRF